MKYIAWVMGLSRNPGTPTGQQLACGEWNVLSGEDKLVALAHDIPRPGLEDGIVEIGQLLRRLPSGHAELVIRNVRTRGVLLHRAGTARRRDELAIICVPPDTWIGREIGWRALSHRRKAQAPGQVNRAGENACEISCMSGHRVLLCNTKQKHTDIRPRFESRSQCALTICVERTTGVC